MAAVPPVCEFDWPAPSFSLPDVVSGAQVTLSDVQGEHGTLVMFICNHCPYVLGVLDRILREATALQVMGIGVVAISSNDVDSHPQDGPEHMKALAQEHGFSFPYLYDATQEVARAYDAVCTPDFFGFNAAGGLQYRGRLDANRGTARDPQARRDLYDAMTQIAQTGQGPRDQTPSMGCSIKWKAS